MQRLVRGRTPKNPKRGVGAGETVLAKVLNWVVSLLRYWRFLMFWEATASKVVFFMYLPILVLTVSLALFLDQLPYPQFILELANQTTLRTGPLVSESWKWSFTLLPLGLTVLNFSYSLVKDVSLSLRFSHNPLGRHLYVLYAFSVVFGLFQVVRGSMSNVQSDTFAGDVLYLCICLAGVSVAAWYVIDQLSRLTPASEFAYCKKQILQLADKKAVLAQKLAGDAGVSYALQEIETLYETLFQVLTNLIQRDMDVYYEEYLRDLDKITEKIVSTIQLLEFERQSEYRRRIKFMSDKYLDHLLVLHQKHHTLEANLLLDSFFGMLVLAATYDRRCLVGVCVPLKTSVIVLVQRRDRLLLTRLLKMVVSIFASYRSRELGAALLYLFYSVLVEAVIAGDKIAINETLHFMNTLAKSLRTKQIKSLYAILWSSAIKSMEHSTHMGAGALLQTLVSRFDQPALGKCLDPILKEFCTESSISSVTIDISPREVHKDGSLQDILDSLNPRYEFIDGSLDYCLEKLAFLWLGQQRHLSYTNAPRSSYYRPPTLKKLRGKYVHYLRMKLKEDGYGLSWTKDDRQLDSAYNELCDLWNQQSLLRSTFVEDKPRRQPGISRPYVDPASSDEAQHPNIDPGLDNMDGGSPK